MKIGINKGELLSDLKKEFPGAWFKDGGEFEGKENCMVWTGEGSSFDKFLPLFDYYSQMYDIYPMNGVHFKLEEFLAERGLFCECQDPGTYLIFKV